MTFQFYAARVQDWNEEDYLILLVYPHHVETVEATAALFGILQESLGGVRFVLRYRPQAGGSILLGAPWLVKQIQETMDVDRLDWRQMPVTLAD